MSQTFGQYGKYRHLEVIPGLLSWGILSAAIVSAFVAPTVAVVFIIIFDLYWMLRVFYFIIHVIATYREYRRYLKIGWYEQLTALPNWDSVYHLVMIPTYQEGLPILEEALESLLRSQYRKDRFIVVIGGEERDQENFQSHQEELQKRYGHHFADLLFTLHPKDTPGEIPGKGSNMRHMGHEVQKYLATKQINPDDIVVSAFDADTVAHPQYFACLAYQFRTVKNPHRSSYQPITLFSNNIWSAVAPVRVAAFGTVFWLFSELVRPERLWTFSSHSMSWRMLTEVGFWEPDLVSEDSRIFLQGFLHYDGDYRVTPIFLPVSMDAVEGGTYWQSLVALYKQQRRWAWGVEHFPYMIKKFQEHPKLPRRLKWLYIFNHLEGMFTWATAPFLIFVLGYLPFLTVSNAESALFVNSPYTLEFMMRGATLGVFITGGLSFFLLPPRPNRSPRWNWLLMLCQWLLLPVTFILFGAIPALDAQTRFMLGKYLGFNVTKKLTTTRNR
ncbi:MAG: glycosyltransferase family 2 protein [Patescibacteria group bacterium]